MAAISQTIVWDAFLWMKNFVFWFKLHCSVFQGSNSQQPSVGLVSGLVVDWRQAIIWTNADPIHWRIYAELEGDELIEKMYVA